MRLLLSRRYLVALGPAIALVALGVGIPTDVLPNPWFTRMTPVRTLDVVLLALTSITIGALLATFAISRGGARGRIGGASGGVTAGAGGGMMSAFAIGCPICNKLVVLALGTSGALSYFEPVQPLLGVGAIVIAVVALRGRVRALASPCAVVGHDLRPVAAER